MDETTIVRFSATYPAELSATIAPLNVELWTALGFELPEAYPPTYDAARKLIKGVKKKKQSCGIWRLSIDPKARGEEIMFYAFRTDDAYGHLQVNHNPDGTWYVAINIPRSLFATQPAAALVAGKLLALALAYQLQAVPLRIDV